MSNDLDETPEWDRLIAERDGRGPTEFEGHESWDDSEQAREAYDRGVAAAKETAPEFWGVTKARAYNEQASAPHRAAG